MNILIITLLVIAVIAFFLLTLWLFLPQKKESINLHLDEKTKLNISHGEDGQVHLDLIYTSYETRPSDFELFPDIVNDAPPTTTLNRDFWRAMAHLDDLSALDKEHMLCLLVEKGIISETQAKEGVLTPDESEKNETSENDAEEKKADTTSEREPVISSDDIPEIPSGSAEADPYDYVNPNDTTIEF